MSDPGEQLSLPGIARAAAKRARPPKVRTPPELADQDPVARVLVDVPLAHLDRPFDYAVPKSMAADARPGVRVKVRFAGQDVDGFVVERAAESAHPGRLQPLRRVVSAEPVLTAEVADLVGRVAARYAGTRSDVLRLAVPARHATVEKEEPAAPAALAPVPEPERWAGYAGGAGFLRRLGGGEAPRAVWAAGPGEDWAAQLAEALAAAVASGRGALACVPDRRDVAALDAALTARLGADAHVVLTADLGPARRYRSFLALTRGTARIAIGTRAAAFAPVRDLGLAAIWDDGDDLLAEPRAPYPHAREVLLLRAELAGCAVLLGGWARSVEAEYLVRSGWAVPVELPREELRRRVAVRVAGDTDRALERGAHAARSRLPAEAFDVLRRGLAVGPVLVQTPRAGYATRLACDRCREPAGCPVCHGPLRIESAGAPPRCGWCGEAAEGWVCPECGGRGLRAPVVGDRRTAEELGRAFPQVPVRSSSGERVLDRVSARPAIVVATPGAEPPAEGGYAAVLILDTQLALARSDLRAGEEALRRWTNAAALAGAGSAGAPTPVLAVGDPGSPVVQALVRWDHRGYAEREIAERQEAHLPPASRMAAIQGDPGDLEAAVAALELPPGAEVLGPVPAGEAEQVLIRVPRALGGSLSAALSSLQARRSARKLAHLRVQVDPRDLG